MYTLIVFVAGVVVGTIFHAVFTKWGAKAKAVGKEFTADVKKELDKTVKQN